MWVDGSSATRAGLQTEADRVGCRSARGSYRDRAESRSAGFLSLGVVRGSDPDGFPRGLGSRRSSE
jgi:hypothetical protein